MSFSREAIPTLKVSQPVPGGSQSGHAFCIQDLYREPEPVPGMYIADDDIDVLRFEGSCVSFVWNLSSSCLGLLIVFFPNLATSSVQ